MPESITTKWQPIETVPRDGTEVLVYRPLAEKTHDKRVAVKKTTKLTQFCWPQTIPEGKLGLNFTDGACFPTHWMPLPEPPHET